MKLTKLMISGILSIILFSGANAQFSHEFNNAGSVENTDAQTVAIGPDGTVFLGTLFHGIKAYDHSDTSFFNLREIYDPNDSYSIQDFTVRSDSIVFYPTFRTLYAYTYDDTTITEISGVADIDDNDVSAVTTGPGGIVFAGTTLGRLRAYTFTATTSFSLLAQYNLPSSSSVKAIAVGPDSIIYVALFGDGFYALSFYEDSTFTQLDHIEAIQAQGIAVGADGTLFLAGQNNPGLMVYNFHDAKFDSVTQWMDPPGALDVAIGADGTIFVANSLDGLRALSFDGSTLTNTAHINPGSDTRDVAVGPDGVIYTANAQAGWEAFTYKVATGINENESLAPELFNLSQNHPNPFNPSTTITFALPQALRITLHVYNVSGHKVKTLLNGLYSAGTHSVHWDGTNEVGQPVASGVYVYILKAGDYTAWRKMILLH